MDVSIIIVNWNTRRILHDCLTSIYKETEAYSFETIVIDNNSTDCSAQMVKTEFPQVLLISNSKNVGFATANNQGIRITRGRYILLLNSDVVILDDAISKVISFADSNCKAGVVACRVCNPDGTLQSTCFMFPSLLNVILSVTYLHKLFPKNAFLGRERIGWFDWSNVCEVDVVAGCFMLVRREAIEQVGLMDDRYFMYGEETDWCYRFKQAGWKVIFAPVAKIIHIGGSSSKQMKPEMTLQLWASILFFLKKYKSRLSYCFACLLVSLFFLLRVPFKLVHAVFLKNERQSHWQTVKICAVGAIKALFGWQALSFRK
jgi:GT2 family glycosyltransferase